MQIPLPQIKEIHTSELTAQCMRSVYHRHRGETESETTSAMFAGNVFGSSCRRLHETGAIVLDEPIDHRSIVESVWSDELLRAEQSKQPATAAVVEGHDETVDEVTDLLAQYHIRMRPLFLSQRLIGCEVPLRDTITLYGDDVEFATHIDLLFRDSVTGRLTVWDWKLAWSKDPSPDYLARNMQLGMMAVALRYGEAQIKGDWVRFNELPAVAWIHGPSLKVYKRKTTLTDGEVMMPGDIRPINRIIRDVEVRNPDAVIREFATRYQMMKSGLWPTSPDHIGCRICQSRKWCPSFDRE